MDLRNKIGQMFRYKIVAKEGTAKEGTAKEGTAKEGIISPPPMEFSLAIEAGSILVGFIGIVIFASQAKSIKDGMSVFGTGLLIALASFLIGALLGFVFGIPRFLQKEQTTEYQENTNLEQISDWLTKILVGVGLVQITLFWQEIPKIG